MIANQYRLHKLGAVDQFVMMYGGLRGAVAFALVLLIDPHVVPHAHMFVTTTIAVVYWTVFVQGITIKPLVKFLNVKTTHEKEPSMNERITGRFMDHIISGMEGVLGEFGNLKVRDMYRQLDIKYIKPCLLRENKVRDPKIIETYETITNNEMVEYIKKNPSSFHIKGNLTSTKSVSQLFQNNADMENVDLKEIHFSQSVRDVTDAKIHHMLTETVKDRENRRTLYSRHELTDSNASFAQPYQMNSIKRRRKRLAGKKRTALTYQKFGKMRVAGSEKTLQDDHIHAVMATEDDNPPAYDDLSDCITFVAPDIRTEEFLPPVLPWRSDHQGNIPEEEEVTTTEPKDYLFFNRRESQGSLFGTPEGRKTSRQINDMEFLNALSNRRRSNTRRSFLKDPEFLPSQGMTERTKFHYENDM